MDQIICNRHYFSLKTISMSFFHAALLALLSFLPCGYTVDARSELRRLITLSRHGSRAPNFVTRQLCPNNMKNLDSYKVPPEQLTEFGLKQLQTVGEHIRHRYIKHEKFLSPSLSGNDKRQFQTYFRSDAAARCSQSASALGLGLYPIGTGPIGFPQQLVPVTMEELKNEHDFAAPKGPCNLVLNKDLIAYARNRGKKMLSEHKHVLKQIGELCGVTLEDDLQLPAGENLILAIKDIADMFIFDRQENLEPLAGLTAELSVQLEQLSFQMLMERYYSTDRMITYWNGGFPDLLLDNLNSAAIANSPNVDDYRYFSYHGHRELLHALGKLLGFSFHSNLTSTSAMNTSSIDPATTIIFELHAEITNQKETYFVRTFIYSPYSGQKQIHLSKCSKMDCPLLELNNIIHKHFQTTGTWKTICGYHPSKSQQMVQQMETSILQDEKAEIIEHTDSSSVYTFVLMSTLLLCLAITAQKRVDQIRRHRRTGYISV